MVERRVNILTDYQDAEYAGRYKALVDKVEAAEQKVVPGSDALAKAVARYAFKLMAIKDEYEVARLYTDGTFRKHLNDTFEGDFKLQFNLAPPLFAQRDPETGSAEEGGLWAMDAERLRPAGEVQGPAWWDVRHLRAHRGAEDGAAPA
ncbi:MAG: DUF6537 domain-containing protein [Thalassobaculum sp.]